MVIIEEAEKRKLSKKPEIELRFGEFIHFSETWEEYAISLCIIDLS